MILTDDQKRERAHSLLLLAQKLYSELESSTETTAKKACKDALCLLEMTENCFQKWIDICNADILLFLVILKELRLLNVESDPLNTSDDLFMPATVRDYFVPKPLEKLCPEPFRIGFEQLETIRKRAYEVWFQHILPTYAAIKSPKEQVIVIDTTKKLAVIHLLSAEPFHALELFHYLYDWSKQSPTLRWLVIFLIALDCPKTASVIAANSSQMRDGKLDKHGTQDILCHALRLGKLLQAETDVDLLHDDGKAKQCSVVTIRSDSLSSFCDCFKIVRPGVAENMPLGFTATRARRCAAQLFFHFNNMDGCATVNTDDVQNCLDTFWYFKMLLNDALIHQRTGRLRRAEVLLREGFNTAFVLCSYYWLVKFSIHLAQCLSLMNVLEHETLQRLLFVQKVLVSETLVVADNDTTDLLIGDAVVTCINKKGSLHVGDANIEVELSRRTRSRDRIISKTVQTDGSHRNTGGSCSETILLPKDVTPYLNDANIISNESMALNIKIFKAVMARFVSGSADQEVRCLEILQKRFCSDARYWDGLVISSQIPLNGDELVAIANEPLWNLLDFYFLITGKVSAKGELTFEEVKIVEVAISLFPSMDVNIFILYYRLTFTLILDLRKWCKIFTVGPSSDISELMTNLRLTDPQKTASIRTRTKNAHGQRSWKENMVPVFLRVFSDTVRQYGHLQFFPWYQLIMQVLGIVHLMNITAEKDNLTSAALFLLESNAISFRQSISDTVSLRLVEKTGCLRFCNEDSFSNALTKLPSDWTVISLHLFKSDSVMRLIMCRLSGRSRPIVIDLGDVISQFDALSEFASVIQDIEASIKVTDKYVFWTNRRDLEKKMEDLLEQLQTDWFGCHKSAFAGFSVEFRDALQGHMPLNSLDDRQLETAFMVTSSLSNDEMSVYLKNTALFKRKQVDELIKAAGKLPEPMNVGPIILILDKELHNIPWEHMPCLRGRPVCRSPSLQFLLHSVSTLHMPKTISCEKVFYVVNPSCDLDVTEDFFKWFSRIKAWHGLFGSQPDLQTMKETLWKDDVYLYCGHGTGVKSLQSLGTIEQLSVKSVAMLMGCSSVKLNYRGPVFEPDGVPFSYLIAQSPCVIGCLWGVTSPDIDRFLAQVLKLWLKVVPPSTSNTSDNDQVISEFTSLLQAIAKANTVCKLPLLTGASVISYGLPIICDKPFSSNTLYN